MKKYFLAKVIIITLICLIGIIGIFIVDFGNSGANYNGRHLILMFLVGVFGGFTFGASIGYNSGLSENLCKLNMNDIDNEIDKSIAKEDARVKKELKETIELIENLKPYKNEYYIEKPYNSVRDILEDNLDE